VIKSAAFALGFLKGAESANFVGIRPSTLEAMGGSMDEDRPMRDRVKSEQIYQMLRSQESPISHLKAMTTGAASIGISLAAASLIAGRKGPMGDALKGAVKMLGIGGVAGAGLGELLRAAQARQISNAKALVKSGPEAIEKHFLKDELEPMGPPGSMEEKARMAASVLTPLAILGGLMYLRGRKANATAEAVSKATNTADAMRDNPIFREYVKARASQGGGL
jgi:hypothetical protein